MSSWQAPYWQVPVIPHVNGSAQYPLPPKPQQRSPEPPHDTHTLLRHRLRGTVQPTPSPQQAWPISPQAPPWHPPPVPHVPWLPPAHMPPEATQV